MVEAAIPVTRNGRSGTSIPIVAVIISCTGPITGITPIPVPCLPPVVIPAITMGQLIDV